jgi:signal transduction histidine kinase
MSVELPRGQRRFYDRELAGAYRTTCDGAFVDCNEAMARILGFGSRDELLAEPQHLRFDGRAASLDRLRASGLVAGEEACLRRRDGRSALVVYSEQLRREPDGRELIEGTLIDVTDRRGRMPGDRLLSALAGGVAHQVTEPLASVVANLGYAIETLSAMGPRGGLRDGAVALEIDRALRDAKRGTDAIRHVLRDLAIFAMPPGATSGTTDLGRVLRSALAVLATELHGRARLETCFEEGVAVAGSEPLLGRCVLQALLDALEAMDDGGKGHLLRVSTRSEPERAVVEIEDSGTRHPPPDRGLGLLGCHAVVAAMRGTLTVTPGGSGGQRLVIDLPRA